MDIEKVLNSMENSEFANETHEDFCNSISNEDNLNFDEELKEFERLDCEAKAVAQNFYVR